MEVNRYTIETMIRDILNEKLAGISGNCSLDGKIEITKEGIGLAHLPKIPVSEADRMDTGKPGDIVYTKDLFSLSESPRLGVGIMEMKDTTFDWTLNYDEVDYVIEGSLSIIINGKTVTAGPGELILIPKGSSIKFSVPNYARFIYVTYPADWANQA